ncbi:MAG TPA: hypothetical protein VH188_09675 [Chthoniobacterales bacterium]|jgi:uncharacterized protein (DUF697 family)|nr:hypothetical protein [Chthoniobacterales bacterium]
MNRPSLLHIIERLEGFLGKLPEAIRRPVLHELTPLKELFLQQRAPRFVLTGANRLPLQEIVARVFGWTPPAESRDLLMELFRWHAIELGGRGTVSFLDARGADARTLANINEELNAQPADMLLHLVDDDAHELDEIEIDNLVALSAMNPAGHQPKTIGIVWPHRTGESRGHHNGEGPLAAPQPLRARLQNALQQRAGLGLHLLQITELRSDTTPQLIGLLARNMPNEARVEMARIAGERAVQIEIAQTLVKSTTAICAAIGAQPIPLADLPILTALQLMMVAGIMYISGRERSLRAATEFITALGVNVGAGVVLREGTRALLKFFPGWGNVVCGAVAGAGTYAIGRAAIVYFLEGLSLKDARRAYLSSRKKRVQPEPRPVKQIEAAR